MRKIGTKLGSVIQGCDIFAAPIFLRFNADFQKKSKTGGCASLILIVLLLSVFYSSWLAVFGKTSMQCQYQTMTQMDPSPYQINPQNFWIAVGFDGIDILGNENGRYFDVIFQIEKREHGDLIELTQVQMVQCQLSHISKFDVDYEQIYKKFHLDKYLCLPDNFNLTLQGKWVSEKFTVMSVNVTNCTSNCMGQQAIHDYIVTNGGFKINFYFLNTLINPTLNDPLSVYFQDKYYNVISDQMAIETNLYFSEYDIQTDESLLPISDMRNLHGIFVDRAGKQQFVHSIQSSTYAIFYYRKSDQKLRVSRVYRKLDDLLSYLGGFFGILAACFGFLVDYNKCCYELEMSNKLFKCENETDEKKQDLTALREAAHCSKGMILQPSEQKPSAPGINFNFFTYLKHLISKVLFFFMPEDRWMQMKQIKDKLQETQNQMNVDVILQKISVYQKAFQCIFSENQMTLLMLQQKMSIEDIKEQRMIMNIEDEQFIENYSKIKYERASIAVAKEPKVYAKDNQAKYQNENSVLVQIYDAIDNLKKKIQEGDNVSKHILEGIREDILKDYQKYKQKCKEIPDYKKSTNNISKFFKSKKNIELKNQLFLTVGKSNPHQPEFNEPCKLTQSDLIY